MKILDHFADIEDFTELLNSADANAETEWERGFIDDMKVKFEKYGSEMLLSEKQVQVLERIVHEL